MKILFVRGAFLNNFEGQNYKYIADRHDFIAISSLMPLQSRFSFPVKNFFSPFDVGTYLSKIYPFLGRVANFFNNRLFGDGHFLVGLEKFVRETGPYDFAIGAETYFGYDQQIARLKRDGLIKNFVSVCWEIIPHNNEAVANKKRIKDEVMKSVDFFICPTSLAKNCLVSEGIDETKIKIIRIGVDQSKFKPEVREKRKPPIVLFVGRLVEEKGVRDLPIIFKRIKQKYRGDQSMKFMVVGSGPLRRLLIEETKNLDIQIDSIQYDRMPEVYRQASILAVPSLTKTTWAEQYGMVIVEAQSCGVPVVAYDSGAIREVVGDGGIIVDEGDINKFADSVVSILEDQAKYDILANIAYSQSKRLYDNTEYSKSLEKLLTD